MLAHPTHGDNVRCVVLYVTIQTLGYRLRVQFLAGRVLGTMVFALHRVAQCQDTKDISRNRVHQAYSAEGFFQGHF